MNTSPKAVRFDDDNLWPIRGLPSHLLNNYVFHSYLRIFHNGYIHILDNIHKHR